MTKPPLTMRLSGAPTPRPTPRGQRETGKAEAEESKARRLWHPNLREGNLPTRAWWHSGVHRSRAPTSSIHIRFLTNKVENRNEVTTIANADIVIQM
jgi:hypothetical protein